MKILVTGGAGFIGSHLIDFLLRSHHITIYDNLSNSTIADVEPLVEKGAKFVSGDVLDYDKLQQISIDHDLIVHLAAKTDVADSIIHPDDTMKVNVEGTENVCKCCVQNKINKLIFASTAAVYADSESPINEEFKTDPQSPYGTSKLQAEKIIKKFANEFAIDAISLRLFNVYGKGQNLQYAGVITKFISNISKELPIEINGDGTQTRDFVSINDVVSAFDCAITHIDAKRGEVYNVGTGKSISINVLAEIIRDFTSKEIEILHRKEIAGEIKHSVADVTLAKNQLGFVAKQKLEDGLTSLF